MLRLLEAAQCLDTSRGHRARHGQRTQHCRHVVSFRQQISSTGESGLELEPELGLELELTWSPQERLAGIGCMYPPGPAVTRGPPEFQPPYFPPPFPAPSHAPAPAPGPGQQGQGEMLSVGQGQDPYTGSLHCFHSSAQVNVSPCSAGIYV